MKAFALLALVLLASVATADHVFTHRIYVAGRLIDKDGLPWPGAEVTVRIDGMPDLTPCNTLANASEVTGPQGDFLLCRHAHEIPAGATATVTAARANATQPIDPELRRVALRLQSPLPRGEEGEPDDAGFGATFRVDVRAFRMLPSPVSIEGIATPAAPVVRTRATITLMDASRAVLANGTALTDENGDATVNLSIGEVPEGALVRAEVGSAETLVDASPAFRRADAHVLQGERPTQAPVISTPTEAPPGTVTPAPSPAWLALVAVALGALLLRKRS